MKTMPVSPRFAGFAPGQKEPLKALINEIEDQLETPPTGNLAATQPPVNPEVEQRLEKMRQWLPQKHRGDKTDMTVLTLKLLKETGYQMTAHEQAQFNEQLIGISLKEPIEKLLLNRKQNWFQAKTEWEKYSEEDMEALMNVLLKRADSHLSITPFLNELERMPNYTPSGILTTMIEKRLKEFKTKLSSPETHQAYVRGVFDRFNTKTKAAQDIATVLKTLAPEMQEKDIQAVADLAAKRYVHVEFAGKFPTGEIFLMTAADSYGPLEDNGYVHQAFLGLPGQMREVAVTNQARGGNQTLMTLDGQYALEVYGSWRREDDIPSVNGTPLAQEYDCQSLKAKR